MTNVKSSSYFLFQLLSRLTENYKQANNDLDLHEI